MLQEYEGIYEQNTYRDTRFSEKLWKLLFNIHLLGIIIFTIILIVRGFQDHNQGFNPRQWYLPLLASTGCSVVTAIAWVLITIQYPGKTIVASLWICPLFTCAVSIMLFNAETTVSRIFALISIFTVIIQSTYTCWIIARIEYTQNVLLDSISVIDCTFGIVKFMAIAIIQSIFFSGLCSLGVSSVMSHRTRFDALYITFLLLSLYWIMHVIRNMIHVAVSHIAYIHFTYGITGFNAAQAFIKVYRRSMGSICCGSLLAPAIIVFRCMARTLKLLAGDNDEFMFSCASCYMIISDKLVACGNRWGYVHVGTHQRSFFKASQYAWGKFVETGMVNVIDTDLTSSFCFICGVTGGMISALFGGIWTTIVDKSYTATISINAFLIGYFMVKIYTLLLSI